MKTVKNLLKLALLIPVLIPFSSSSAVIAQTGNSTRFQDTQGYWAAACIDGIVEQGILQGYPNGSFRPGRILTRAELAAVMLKAYPNAPTVQTAPKFTDIPPGFWAAKAIQQAYERGWLVGYPNRQFKPNQALTKTQALVMLAKIQQVTAIADTEATLNRYFVDQTAIPGYARDAIAALTQANLVVNYPNLRELKPEAAIARGELAALLCQAKATNLKPQARVPAQYQVQFKSLDNGLWQQATLLKEFPTFHQADPGNTTAILRNQLFFFAPARDATTLLQYGNNIATGAVISVEPNGLWATDGTTAGTRLVSDRILPIDPDPQPASAQPSVVSPQFIGTSGQRLWFTTDPSATDDLGARLWSSDGTTAGTRAIATVSPELSQVLGQASRLDTQPNLFLNGNFVFSVVTPSQTQIWQSDGQTLASRLGQFPHQSPQGGLVPGSLTSTGKQLFFTIRDAQGNSRLWRSDGTPGGAIALQTLNPAGEPFTPWQDRIYLEAETLNAGWEWWTSDGSPEGTRLLKDIHPGTESAAPRLLTGLGSTFFALANSPQGFELWATQGEPTSTRRVKRLSSVPSNRAERTAFVHNGRLFFSFPSPTPVAPGSMVDPAYELWVTDGTESGTQRLAMFPTGDVGEFTVFRDRLFFRGGGPEGQELWSSDGTSQGTQQVIDLNTGTTVIVAPCAPPPPNQRPNCPPPVTVQNSSLPRDLTVQVDWLYFFVHQARNLSLAPSPHHLALYRTQGTAQTTERIQQFSTANDPFWYNSGIDRIVQLNPRLVIMTPNQQVLPGQSEPSNRLQFWSLSPTKP